MFDDGLDHFVLVDGVPVAPKAKLPVLEKVLRSKVFKDFKLKNVTLAADPETGNGIGAAYLEFARAHDASECCEKMNNFKLDKKHTLKVLPLSKFNQVLETDEELTLDLPEMGNVEDSLTSFMLEPNACDQFLIHTDPSVSICKNRGPQRTVIEQREGWTEARALWSPKGTYLATMHKQGIALWGLPKFERLARFGHTGVRTVQFSPCERFIVTQALSNPEKTVIVWNVETQKECRSFAIPLDKEDNSPVFQWSYDGSYFARMVENAILVYETKTFTKLDKKNIVIRDLKEFQWSPAANIISFWTPATAAAPFRVSLMKIPSRDEVASRNMFKVEQATMFWQKSGDHLAARVEKKKGKKITHDLEVFFLSKKDVPFEHIGLDFEVISVAWEPVGTKFAVLVKETAFKHRAVFYNFIEGKMTVIGDISVVPNTEIAWSPKGEFCVLVPLRHPEARLQFLQVTETSCEKLQEGMHDNISMFEWDPTGRFIVTAVTRAGANLDFGYKMWWFTGALVDEKEEHSGLLTFQWRPRAPELLTKEEEAEVAKSIKKHWAQFEEADKLFSQRSSEQEKARRDELYQKWNERRARKKDILLKYQRILDSREDIHDTMQTVLETKLVLMGRDRQPLE